MGAGSIDLPSLSFSKPSYSDVPPASSCMLCRKVPLDNSYSNTLTFSNEAEQLAYFESKQARKYESISPIALQKPIRFNIAADGIFDCNYCVIKNSNITSKNLFCFITRIEYVNMNTCDVFFEIDVMQTYFFNMNIRSCFVEREHVNDDTIGKHTINEGIPYGDYKEFSVGNPPNLGNKVIIGQIADAKKGGGVYGGVYHGLSFTKWALSKANELEQVLKKLAADGKQDSVVSLSMGYDKCVPAKGTNTPAKIQYSVTKRVSNIDGYVPRNKKLLCYPYNFLYCENSQGQSGAYRFEMFSTPACRFEVWGTFGSGLELTLVPKNYNGLGINYDERMSISGFPMCSWVSDTYRAWFAQNKYSVAIDALGSAFGLTTGMNMSAMNVGANASSGKVAGAMSSAMGGLGGMVGAAKDFANIGNTFYQSSIAPDKVKGNSSSSSVYASNKMNFQFTQKCIRKEYAKSIDDYLTVFGYRVNKIGVPKIRGRRSFNYVKTNGSSVTGDIPFNFLALINNIFDRGIFFWHGDYVGDFGRDNSIV